MSTPLSWTGVPILVGTAFTCSQAGLESSSPNSLKVMPKMQTCASPECSGGMGVKGIVLHKG